MMFTLQLRLYDARFPTCLRICVGSFADAETELLYFSGSELMVVSC